MKPFSLLATLALPSTAWTFSIAERTDELVDCLKSSLSPEGGIISPDDPGFTNDTIRFSSFNEPTFRLVAQVANEDDVRTSIKCAKKTGTTFLFTGPRHGAYSGFSKLDNALEIFTSAFNGIQVNAEENIMTVGGAVVFKDAIDALHAVGKNIPVGSGPCVGIVGASIGGGIGRLEGLYGIIADSLLSVRIMLPNTTVVEASAETNPELFWGIRGAGFNFGFILNATYQIYDAAAGGTNYNADFEYPISAARDFYQALKDAGPTMPAPLCISTYLSWSSTYNTTTLKANAVYAGPERDGRRATRFLRRVGPVLRKNITDVPWNELSLTAFFDNGDETSETCGVNAGARASMGAAFNELTVDAHVSMTEQFNYLLTRYPQMRDSDNSMYFCATQAVRALPNDATSYPWRQAIGHQTWGFAYTDGITDAEIEYLPQRIRATIADSAGTDGLNTYVGFSRGDERLESLYSREHMPRLAALKKTYDPEGLFNAYHPLPTSYP